MRVLHVSPSIARAYGGPTYSLVGYARAAVATGHEVTIVASRPRPDDSWLSDSLPQVEIRTFRNYGHGAFFTSPALHMWLRRNASQYNVVHVHGLLNPISSLAARACIRRGWPLVIRPFGTMSRYTFTHRRGSVKRAYSIVLDRSSLRRAGAIHFTTNEELAGAAWQGICLENRAVVIPPPWVGMTAEVRESSQGAHCSVLLLSRLHPVKNVELLLDAWPLVRSRLPGAQLTIAGDGDPGYVRKLQVRARPLGGSVHFLGHIEGVHKGRVLAESDLFVLPSLHENFGIAVMEALAAGLPVVITREVQLSNFVREHGLGLVADRSVASLADAIVTALSDHELRGRCRSHAAAILERYFSVQEIGKRLLDMYHLAIMHTQA